MRTCRLEGDSSVNRGGVLDGRAFFNIGNIDKTYMVVDTHKRLTSQAEAVLLQREVTAGQHRAVILDLGFGSWDEDGGQGPGLGHGGRGTDIGQGVM